MLWSFENAVKIISSPAPAASDTCMRSIHPHLHTHLHVLFYQVESVQDMGAYVKLLEYNNIEGMILLSELSRRRIRSINKLIRVGRTEVVVVLRVDQEKGYIDLSKRRVSAEDIAKCEKKYNKSRCVHGILRHVSETMKVPLVKLYEDFGWDLYKRFGHAFDAFKLITNQG